MAETGMRTTRLGDWILLVSSLGGLLTAVIAAFHQGNGIAYSGGAYLVLLSSALLVSASVLLAVYRPKPKWLTPLLATLIFLDLVGTAVAAYFLEAAALMTFMALGLAGWLIYLLLDPADKDTLSNTTAGRPA
jgi:hypothetical protein